MDSVNKAIDEATIEYLVSSYDRSLAAKAKALNIDVDNLRELMNHCFKDGWKHCLEHCKTEMMRVLE